MARRYIVHGIDTESGERVRKVFESASAAAAEETARRIGVEVLGVEVDTGGEAGARGGTPSPGPASPDHPLPRRGEGGRRAGASRRVAQEEEADAEIDDDGLPATDESGEWHGRPSQWQNFWWYLACVLVIPIPIALWKHLTVATTVYTLTSQRFQKRWGILTKRLEEVELYRVKDTECTRTLLERLLGVGTLTLHTSDKTADMLTLRWVKNPEGVRELLREHVEAVRRTRGVREMDFTGMDVE